VLVTAHPHTNVPIAAHTEIECELVMTSWSRRTLPIFSSAHDAVRFESALRKPSLHIGRMPLGEVTRQHPPSSFAPVRFANVGRDDRPTR
jgi:hypothetical protein